MSSLEGEARMAAAAGDRKTHQPRSESRDGMRIDWDVPIAMDDGLVLRADVFRPVAEGRYPVILSYGPYAKGLAFQDGYPSAWQRMAEEHPDVAAGSQQSVPELGSGRSGEMGAARLCLRARRFARRRLLAGLHRSFLAARDQGFLRLHRMGRRAALVERQGRAQRHLLLRHQPVARRDPAAAAPRRHVHLGGRRRLVPRHDASRRHPLHVLGKLVRHAGEDRAVRRRRARQAQPRARRAGLRAGNAFARPNSPRTAATSAARSAPIRSTTTITGRARRSGRRSRCRSSRPPTGAARGCIRAAISRASCARRRSRNGSRRTASSTGRISTPTTAASCSCASSTISCTARTTAGTSSRRCCCRCVTSTASSSARRTNGRSRARSGRSFYLDPADGALADKPAKQKTAMPFRRHGRRRHLPQRAASQARPRSPAHRR